MITIHTVTIIEKTRADYRRTLTELFLSEAPGAAVSPLSMNTMWRRTMLVI